MIKFTKVIAVLATMAAFAFADGLVLGNGEAWMPVAAEAQGMRFPMTDGPGFMFKANGDVLAVMSMGGQLIAAQAAAGVSGGGKYSVSGNQLTTWTTDEPGDKSTVAFLVSGNELKLINEDQQGAAMVYQKVSGVTTITATH